MAILCVEAIEYGITHVRGARVTVVTSLGIRYGLAAIEDAAQVLRATDPVIADHVIGYVQAPFDRVARIRCAIHAIIAIGIDRQKLAINECIAKVEGAFHAIVAIRMVGR